MKKILIIFIVLFLCGCSIEPTQTALTNNKKVNVDILFDFDGVRIYRFSDAGDFRYFAKAIKDTDVKTFDSHTVSTGKSSYTVNHEIETIGCE